jgi:hypothetical protein
MHAYYHIAGVALTIFHSYTRSGTAANIIILCLWKISGLKIVYSQYKQFCSYYRNTIQYMASHIYIYGKPQTPPSG